MKKPFSLRLPFFKSKKEHNEQQAAMIRRIGALSELDARSVMVPRVDVVAIDDSLPMEEIVRNMASSIHSRFPVYRDTIDSVIGIIYIKDMVRVMNKLADTKLESLLREPFFVPETIHLDKLLHEMRRRHMHIAVAVDEYGGVSGIVCMEDIIEEIIGEIQDEFDNETEECIKLSDNVYLVDGRMPIAKCNEELSIRIPDEDYDTVGGFVYHLFGKIPFRYEQAVQHLDGTEVRFVVTSMAGNKIKSVKIEINPGAQNAQAQT